MIDTLIGMSVILVLLEISFWIIVPIGIYLKCFNRIHVDDELSLGRVLIGQAISDSNFLLVWRRAFPPGFL